MATEARKFPGGSRERVSRAGRNVRDGTATEEDVSVIDTWRESHRHVINSFQAILRSRTRGTGIVVAQRHKRKRTIFDKLNRYPKMQLGRMDDVAGCRLIFQTLDELHTFRDEIHHANFNHRLRNAPDKYDYIKHPKEDGYRGIHDVYEYDVRSTVGRSRKGLLIELQYRTNVQHAWATCVEVVGFLTVNQPKFGRGDRKIQHILRLASEIISRAFEGMKSSLPDRSDKDIVDDFVVLDRELKFIQMLNGLDAANSEISGDKNVILIFRQQGAAPEGTALEIKSFSSGTAALRALFELERSQPGIDIVLVKGDRPEYLREAFKNYFSDAQQFVKLVENGRKKLLGPHIKA